MACLAKVPVPAPAQLLGPLLAAAVHAACSALHARVLCNVRENGGLLPLRHEDTYD